MTLVRAIASKEDFSESVGDAAQYLNTAGKCAELWGLASSFTVKLRSPSGQMIMPTPIWNDNAPLVTAK